ncbi:MAG: type II CRISPR RNA-guided endonuclease Cas9 [Acidimicrobiaceae bacterium]|nr:type II CRISPR RNA-guided endonuclease Cas9 [Acidimicrobiaceae bacterium]
MFSAAEESPKYVLGLDLGSASLGWALVALNETNNPTSVICTGVRIFEPGVDGTALEIQEGKDKSKAVERRTARLQRRQLRRRAYRQGKLFQLLQQHGLLPHAESSKPLTPSEDRDAVLTAFDQQIYQKWRTSSPAFDFAQLPLYQLRKIALDHKLEPYELGRTIYHFSQRRGFKSNRKEGRKESDKELGAVKTGIAELEKKMKTVDARTLGEYFAGLDPHQVGQNVRRRWTARKMYEDEFSEIWKNQANYYPELLNQNLRREISHWLFYQRPIAAQSHLIGKCELEGNNHRRAAWATLEAQRFRILQKVNDLKIIYPGNPDAQPLTPEERKLVFDVLDSEGDQTFAKLRTQLKLDKKSEFNLERGDEKRLRGNRTNKTMISVFGEQWNAFSDEEQKQVVEDWRTSESEDSLVRRGIEHWGLDEIAAQKWADSKPEDGHCALSRRAISRLLPLMFDGMSFKESETKIYGNRFSGGVALDKLPPLHVHRKINNSEEVENLLTKLRLGSIRNPAVERGLTELRKVVNSIVREYGKPYEIRVELARELKKPRKERESATKQNRTRQKEREKTKANLLRECGIQNPSRADIEKALLYEECGGICPYTGRSIFLSNLFGEHPQFDVEHIIPLSRYPDDSFQNKTLCWHEENRNIKRNKTPFEAYSKDTARWEEMQVRIKAWKQGNPGKLKRFMLRSEDELEEFTTRQMNDTRYASVLACRLLESLYGGRDEATPIGTRQAIYASSGAVTATLRRMWGLEAILREAIPSNNGQSKGKPRTDHRHHAIDAIAIALTRQRAIQAMARSASLDRRLEQDSRAFRSIPSPWPNFIESIRPHIEHLIVSHRPEHKMSGALHDETNYGRPYKHNGKSTVNVRKPVTGLSASDIEKIVDSAVQSAVRQKAAELNGDLTQCESAQNWPSLPSSDGKVIPIKRVRIRKVMTPTPIASGPRERQVALANNHHAAIFAKLDGHGKEVRWDSIPVSLYEAMERKRKKMTVIQRAYPEFSEYQFKFSLMNGDIVEILEEGVPLLYRLRSIESNGAFFLLSIRDARMVKEIVTTGDRWRPSADALRKLSCRKVNIDTLGRVHPAND